jgi:hypothetical protein
MWQWNIQSPGLSATKAMSIRSRGAISTVSCHSRRWVGAALEQGVLALAFHHDDNRRARGVQRQQIGARVRVAKQLDIGADQEQPLAERPRELDRAGLDGFPDGGKD